MEKSFYESIKNEDVLEFVVFCIESVAESLDKDPALVYHAFMENNILNGYIVPCFDALHTQSKGYIVDELLRIMAERQVTI